MPRNRRPRVRPGHRPTEPPARPTPPAPPTAPDIDLDEAVAELNRIYITGGLRTTVAVGQYILDTFFDGDIAAFSAKGGHWPSFRALYHRSDLALAYGVLTYSVQVAHQVGLLPETIAWKLNTSHHRALVKVKDLDTKTELARTAVDKKLTRKQLRAEIYRAVGHDPSRPGRTQLSPPALAVRKVERTSREFATEMGPDGVWDHVPEEEQADVAARLARTIRRLQRVLDDIQ